jgi:hypothetical protein
MSTYRRAMPKHDFPDGDETRGNLIDFREHLRRRVDRSAQDNDDSAFKGSNWKAFRYAENSDGKPPSFSRYDLLLAGLFLALGLLLWQLILR